MKDFFHIFSVKGYLPELFASLLICYNTIPMAVNFTGVVPISILLLYSLFQLFVLNRKIPIFEKKSVFLTYVIIIWFSISFVIAVYDAPVFHCLTSFVCFGIPFLFFPIYRLNVEKICSFIFAIGVLFLPFFATYDYGFSVTEGGEDVNTGSLMSVSYIMLQYLFASFYFVISKRSITTRLIATIVFLIYAFIFVVVSARGAIVAVVFFLVLNFVVYPPNKYARIRRFVLATLGIAFFVLSFEPIINYLYESLERNGYSIVAIGRLHYTLEHSYDLTSGRTELIDIGIKEFWNSPIWGNGVGSFNNYSGAYPHNLFVQVLQEGGILFAIPLFLILARGVLFLLNCKINNPYYKFYCIVFCAGIIQLMFSKLYWQQHFLWLFCHLQLMRSSPNVGTIVCSMGLSIGYLIR